jgi:ubiquitin-like modifier-activating enzyme ATG7
MKGFFLLFFLLDVVLIVFRGKPGPRVADISALLNSALLMKQAVDLNLRLMKWRMWPSLRLGAVSSLRCLLIGSGTLGCSVARCLIGWGIREITFLDNGIVSFSNPVRQCLFEYEDCLKKSYKAIVAANRLKKIFPELQAKGVVMSVPMLGYPFHESTEASAAAVSHSGFFLWFIYFFTFSRRVRRWRIGNSPLRR